jgi:aminoglycoside phosphotransferase (APT) family kinase protein
VQKQRDFQPLRNEFFSVSSARIDDVQQSGGKIHVFMEYCDGLNGEGFATHGDRASAIYLGDALSALLARNATNSVSYKVASDPFLEKIDQVISNTSSTGLIPLLLSTRERISAFFAKHKNVEVLIGPCHGDLTLSNMILSPSRGLVLIDFLDTYFESPLQDVAKLQQDFFYGWSCRKSDGNLKIKSEIFNRIAAPRFARELQTRYRHASVLFSLLCLSRIAPYLNGDPQTECWLIRSLEDQLHHLKEM